MGQFLVAAKAFHMLERLDGGPEMWEGLRGAVCGCAQAAARRRSGRVQGRICRRRTVSQETEAEEILVCTLSIISCTSDNSLCVEGDNRYIRLPDGEGVPHLVDLEAPAESDALPIRSGIDNQYWLYTRRNPHHAQTLVHNSVKSIWASNYNVAAPTKVIVHGWTGNANSSINPLITEAFLSVGECNVIVVDWSSLASRCYTTAVLGVPDVGEYLGNFLIWLFDVAGGDWSKLHLVGFSLGAHVVGNAGRTASGRPGRVTGLDPALPLWHKNPDRLGTDSAAYVESIHTDGAVLGFMKPIGHVDFYPNGGTTPQPGCWCSICSHFRAPELFASSVKNNHFVGHRCANLIAASIGYCHGETLKMGNDDMDKQGYGLYGLTTGASWPF